MKRTILIIGLIILTIYGYSQTPQNGEFNFGFEKASSRLPDRWFEWGKDYSVTVDTIVKHGGNNSVLIEPSETRTQGSFGCIAFSIPALYESKEIELKAYMKLQDVSDGTIGLMLRIDGPSGGLQFDNMMNRNITGTSDWTQYSVKLPYPPTAKTIYIGALLSGKGKLWVDDFELLLDGVSIEKVKQIEPKVYKADLDKEFNSGSGINTIDVTPGNLQDLKALGLIWGFLKYYHPAIAEGNYNWDNELFRILPKVINTKNTNRDAILTEWISQLGPVNPGKEVKTSPEKIKIEPDLGWIENSGFSDELKSILLKIKNADRTGIHYYINFGTGAGNPDFTNEKPYPRMIFNDAGYRILALYRYWNMIQYYYPYRNLIGENWKNVLEEFIPKIIAANNETEYNLILLELVARIHDSHANIYGRNEIIDKHRGLNSATVELKFIENKAVVTGFYNDTLGIKTGLKIGDVITKVNNQPVEEIVKARLKLTPASNYPTQLRDIAPTLLRTNDSIVKIEFTREGVTDHKTLATYSLNKLNIRNRYLVSDTCFKLLESDIAYINNGSLKIKYLPEIWEKMQHCKGLIIDIRNYPSEFPIYELSNYLMPKRTPFVKFTSGSILTPGLFTFGDSLLFAGNDNKDYYKGKVCILVIETSVSSAEFHSMAYRVAPNATVIGSTTAGADGNVSPIYFPGGIMTMISGIGVYYPDGRETQRVGIIPDIEVRPTINGIKAGKDEVLQKAIEIINRK